MKQPFERAVNPADEAGGLCEAASRKWVLAATILASSMAFIDGTVVNVALPALQSSLHATVVDVQWVVEAYGLFLSALILVGGSLGDSLGRRKMFLLGVAVFAVASVGCGFSSNITSLIIWRCVQGVCAAFLVPGSLAIISASFEEKSRGQAIGTWSGFTAITTALGPVLGGWLIEHVSWHWVFFINVPLAALVIAIVYAFLESTTRGWRNPRILGSLIAGTASLIVFLVVEKNVTAPMVPLGLFRSRSFSGANLVTLLLYAALGIFFFLFPLNLIQIQGYSATATGAAALPAILIMFFLSRWSGGLVAHYGAKTPLIVGPIIAAAGFLLFAVPSVGTTYWTTFFPAFVVLGLGMAISVAPLTTVVMSSVEEDRAGTASGINNAVARVAGVLAIAVFGVVMVKAFGHALEELLRGLNLDPSIVQFIQSNLVKLGGLVPPTQDPKATATIQDAIAHAFVYGFRTIMVLCAALALGSAAFASRMIPSKGAESAQKFGRAA